MSRKAPRLPVSPVQLGLLVSIGLLLMLGFGYAGRLIASSELQGQVAQWEEDVRLEAERVQQNQSLLAEVQSDEYVIAQARQELGWAFPGEVAVRVAGEEDARGASTPVAADPTPSWQLWWQRFFGP